LQVSGCAARIVITSDDDEIIGWAATHGVETHQRPAELASPEATISDVAVNLVEHLNWTGLVGVLAAPRGVVGFRG